MSRPHDERALKLAACDIERALKAGQARSRILRIPFVIDAAELARISLNAAGRVARGEDG